MSPNTPMTSWKWNRRSRPWSNYRKRWVKRRPCWPIQAIAVRATPRPAMPLRLLLHCWRTRGPSSASGSAFYRTTRVGSGCECRRSDGPPLGHRRRAIYALRKSMVEPVYGIIKSALGFRQFHLRGLHSASGEWTLVTIACNLKRLFNLRCAAARTAAAACLKASDTSPNTRFCPPADPKTHQNALVPERLKFIFAARLRFLRLQTFCCRAN